MNDKILPDGWQWKKLGEIAFIKGGKRLPAGKKLLLERTKFPYIRVADFNDNGSINLENIQFIDSDIFKVIKNYIITINDLYISIAGTIGKTGIIPNELNGANLTENAARLVYKNSEKQDNKFVYYFTKSSTFNEQIEDATKTVAQPKLALTRLAEVEIPLPPLAEQKRIVAKIDAAFGQLDEAISLQKTNIARTETLKKALLVEQFSELPAEKKKLGDVVKMIDGDRGSNYPKKGEFSDKDYCLFLSTKNVREFGFKFKENIFISKKKHEQLRSGKLEKGDVVITTRGTLGNIAVYDETVKYDVVRLNSGMLILRILKSNLDKYFLAKFLISPVFKRQLQEKQTGSAQPQIPANILKEIKIPLPPLAEQERIVAYLDKSFAEIDKMLNAQKIRLAHLEGMKKAILQEAFEGGL